MDHHLKWIVSLLHTFLFFFISTVSATSGVGGGVIKVQHKFAGQDWSLNALKAHDSLRHSRILASFDLPLGGIGNPGGPGLYFAKIGIGSPSKDYYVQVDTGSDIFWVNCIQCNRCPKKSGLPIELKLYDPNASTTSKLVSCDQEFCSSTYEGPFPSCLPNSLCEYTVLYGDGSSSSGYFVKDFVQFNRVSGDFLTTSANASVIFGCGATQSGDLGSSKEALDGLLGFGRSNSSMISQLASSGKVKKMFAHCLDGVNGGGIFAVGQVVQPKVKLTPLVPNQSHYNVNLKTIDVGKTSLQLPTDVFETKGRTGTIIDSGTTLAYLPKVAYDPLISKIMSNQTDLRLDTVDNQFLCFQYSGSVDDGFPTVTFHFENSVPLIVHPHDYLFQYRDQWCIGWQNSGLQSKDGKDITLLGDLVLSNKLVVYDLENQVVGWTDYNCSSSVKLQDEPSGTVYVIGAHDLSSASSLDMGRVILLLLLTAKLHSLFFLNCCNYLVYTILIEYVVYNKLFLFLKCAC